MLREQMGSNMHRNSAILTAGGLAIGLVLSGAPSHAGDNNMINVKQEGLGGGGNSLFIDQSAASNSLVVGPSDDAVDAVSNLSLKTVHSRLTPPDAELYELPSVLQIGQPALQKGSGNEAGIYISGDASVVQLHQDNSFGQPNEIGTGGNWAEISASAFGTFGAVIQLGNLNDATLNLTGEGASGLIAQNGSGLEATLNVASGGTGQIIQNGNGSEALLNVPAGGNAIYTQNGDNLQPTVPAEVFSSNPGTIFITQTGF